MSFWKNSSDLVLDELSCGFVSDEVRCEPINQMQQVHLRLKFIVLYCVLSLQERGGEKKKMGSNSISVKRAKW